MENRKEKNMKYLEQVKAQLENMSELEKDTWILTQAKVIAETKQQDFLLSLKSEKLIIDMPSLDDIDLFFQHINNGELYFETEKFNTEGNDCNQYDEMWIWYNDPLDITSQLNNILSGCHKLLCLEDYQLTFDLLSKAFQLRFHIKNSEGLCGSEVISIMELEDKCLCFNDLSKTEEDLIISMIYAAKDQDENWVARNIIGLLCNPLCHDIDLEALLERHISQELYSQMIAILDEETKDIEETDTSDQTDQSNLLLMQRSRKELLFCLQFLVPSTEKIGEHEEELILKEAWEDIRELDFMLKCEPYIDDQLQMDDIYEICENIIHSSSLAKENWALRKSIIEEIVENDYYDSYGCNDEMEELAEKLCTNQEEFLYYADLLYATDWYKEKGADIYLRYDQDDKYLSYLNMHDVKKNKAYHTLMKYYQEHDQEEKACEVARLGMEKCKDCDVTEMMLLLLLNAKKQGDQKQFNKFLQSARRRKHVDMERINRELQNS